MARGLVSERRRFSRLLADPPRTGAKGLAPLARALGVRRLVYVACDAAALARDAKDLKAEGFRPESLQLIDMFPQTRHIEAVMAFTRKDG